MSFWDFLFGSRKLKPKPLEAEDKDENTDHGITDTLDLLDKTTKSLEALDQKFAEIRDEVRQIRKERDSWPTKTK